MPTHLQRNGLTRRILSVVAMQVLVIGMAAAVCEQPNPKVCAEFFKSDAVLIGTVVSQTSVIDDAGYDGWVYRLRVKEVYRGPTQDVIEVYTGNDSARFPLDSGETYLLFTSMSEKRLTFTCCGNSAKLSEAGDALRQLKELVNRLKFSTHGDVSGVVSEFVGTDSPGVPGVLVTARRGSERFRGVTGTDGWFHIPVPPGEYTVTAQSSNQHITAYDLSYDDPKHVVVAKCGCTAIQFLAH